MILRKHLSTRLFWLVGSIAVVPLASILFLAVRGSIVATEQTAKEGLQEVANQTAGRMEEIVASHVRVLEGLAETMGRAIVDRTARQSLLDGYTLRFPELKRVVVVNSKKEVIAGSDPTWTPSTVSGLPVPMDLSPRETRISDLIWKGGLMPTIQLTHRLNDDELLLAEINIAKLWELVESIRIGDSGRLLLLDRNHHVIAHGAPQGKKFILDQMDSHEPTTIPYPSADSTAQYRNLIGVPVVAAAQTIRSLDWKVVIEQDQAEAFAASHWLSRLLLLSGGLLVILIAFAGTRFSRKMTRPLEELVEATKEVAKGNLSIQVNVVGNDERAHLAEAFNQMVGDLRQLHELIAQRERMAVIGRIAGELVHDLRHPVRNIENAAHLINSRGDEPAVREMFQRVTLREFEGLNRFLQNLETLISEPVLQPVELDVAAELRSIVEALQNSTEGNTIRWDLPKSELSLHAVADRFALRRVLQNLLRNAVEASPEGETIRVGVTVEGNRIAVHVQDQGPGIPADRVASLFDALRTTKRRGIGLGLAICKKLVTEMGGEIGVSNHGEGGAQFSVSLPRPMKESAEAIEGTLKSIARLPGSGKKNSLPAP
ncbi:MAG TPA: sensor histidine kinase [Bdellovibrionota bacterium]|nr:sensor histidine kinase [Bdellovibrionota bacterium]